MKFLTGDDTGLLKLVHVESKKIERFGPKRRGDAAEKLCWAGPPERREARVAVGYASGLLELRDGVSGAVLASAQAVPRLRCCQVLGSGFLAISTDGSARVVRDWCSEEGPVAEDEEEDAAEQAESSKADGGNAERKPLPPSFTLPAPISHAELDPRGSNRLVFGGGDNDIKIYDVAREQVTWRAKNMREDFLCLRPPIKISTVHWATEMAPSRSLILCGTTDGKVRLYDANMQRRPLFELKIGFMVGKGSGGHTGVSDDLPRPVNCSMVAQVRGQAWSLFLGDTVGMLREYDLRNLPDCQASKLPTGRKSHYKHAAKQLPYKQGYKNIMGSVRALDVHPSGHTMVAVSLGRHAYVYETKRRQMTSKVYLKQKLCSVLISSEEQVAAEKKEDDDVTGDEKEVKKAAKRSDGPEGSEDEVEEGFSDDENEEEEVEGEDDEEDIDMDSEDESDSEDEGAQAGRRGRGGAARGAKRTRSSSGSHKAKAKAKAKAKEAKAQGRAKAGAKRTKKARAGS